jgi:hypothetical protein
MTKIVIGAKIPDMFGGRFGLSWDGYNRLKELGFTSKNDARFAQKRVECLADNRMSDDGHNLCYEWYKVSDIARDDPRLVQVVEEMGPLASGYDCNLKIVEIPDGVEWEIHQGGEFTFEHIEEKHREWS